MRKPPPAGGRQELKCLEKEERPLPEEIAPRWRAQLPEKVMLKKNL